jgi:hypothetical protein
MSCANNKSEAIATHKDAIALATAIVACRLADGPSGSPDAREVQLIRSMGLDVIRAMDDDRLDEVQLLDGLTRFSQVCASLAEIAVEIIESGRRSGFNIKNLDEFLASPYIMPVSRFDWMDSGRCC